MLSEFSIGKLKSPMKVFFMKGARTCIKQLDQICTVLPGLELLPLTFHGVTSQGGATLIRAKSNKHSMITCMAS